MVTRQRIVPLMRVVSRCCLLAMMVSSSSRSLGGVSAEVLTFCPPGENAKVNDLETHHDCQSAHVWIRTTMLPACLAAGRQTDRQQVFKIDLTYEEIQGIIINYEQDNIFTEVEGHEVIVTEEEVPTTTVGPEEEGGLSTTTEEIANRRLRRRNLEVSSLEEIEADSFHHRMLGSEVPDCYRNFPQCKGPKPHPACCILCPKDCYSTNPKSRRQRHRRQEVIQGEVTAGIDAPAAAAAAGAAKGPPVEEEDPLTEEELAQFAAEARVTMKEYLAYVDTLCSSMYQMHAEETACFGDTPSTLQCNSFIVI